jgi:MFS family permease
MTETATRSGVFRSLQHRNARLFFGGLLVSNIGTWLQMTAMGILVYRLTGRATDLGINIALQFLPMLFLGAWAGAVSDRVNKRTMALITQSALAAQAIVLGVLDLAGLLNLPMVYVLSFALGVINAMDNPARRGLVTELVDPVDIPNAVSLNTAVMTGSRIFGPALAAALVDPLGTGWLFIINGVTFAAVLVSLLMMNTAELHAPPPAKRGGTPVRDALRFVQGNHRVWVLFVTLTVVSTFAFNYSVSFPKLADNRWGDERWFGWMLAITSIGSVIGSLATARLSTVTMRWFLGSTLMLGVAGPFIAWSPNVAWAAVFALPLGFGGAGFLAAVNSITQVESPPDMRGRLLALTAVAFLGSTPVGGPITGVVADTFGAEWSLAYGSLITIVVVVWAAWALSRRRAADELAAQDTSAADTVSVHARRVADAPVVGLDPGTTS